MARAVQLLGGCLGSCIPQAPALASCQTAGTHADPRQRPRRQWLGARMPAMKIFEDRTIRAQARRVLAVRKLSRQKKDLDS